MLSETIHQQQQGYIDIRSLKTLATEILPNGSILRAVLIREPDILSPHDFVAKLGTWLEILDEEEI
jgi:hypothetical protein